MLIVSIFAIFLISTSHITHEESDLLNCNDRAKHFQGSKSNSTSNGYELIHIISHPNRTGDINLTLCWIVDDQIQVGKLITLDAKASSDRYMVNTSNHKIVVILPNDHINYWVDPNKSYIRQHMYENSNKLVLTQKTPKTFESEPINFRLTVPIPISITYCEYFPNEECFTVNNLLQPASYYLDQELDLTRQTLNLANQTLILTELIRDLTYDFIELTCFIAYANIVLVVLTVVFLINVIYDQYRKTDYNKKSFIFLAASASILCIFVLGLFMTLTQCLPSYNSS